MSVGVNYDKDSMWKFHLRMLLYQGRLMISHGFHTFIYKITLLSYTVYFL